MRDVYVLKFKPQYGGAIVEIATRMERANMRMACYIASVQDQMTVENHNLLEDDD